jgi:hypothetical protein
VPGEVGNYHNPTRVGSTERVRGEDHAPRRGFSLELGAVRAARPASMGASWCKKPRTTRGNKARSLPNGVGRPRRRATENYSGPLGVRGRDDSKLVRGPSRERFGRKSKKRPGTGSPRARTGGPGLRSDPESAQPVRRGEPSGPKGPGAESRPVSRRCARRAHEKCRPANSSTLPAREGCR